MKLTGLLSTTTTSSAANARSKTVDRWPQLDLLRGVAVILVLIYHGVTWSSATEPAYTWPQLIHHLRTGCWLGVDLFFVLSGFLITGILLDTQDHPRRAARFYWRRGLRILPLFYGLVLSILYVLPSLLMLIDDRLHRRLILSSSWSSIWHSQLWLWTYTHNFLQANRPSALPGLGHLWSLAVEQQFYLVWPLVVWQVSRRGLMRILVGLIVVSPLLRGVLWGAGTSPWWIFQATPTRLDTLMWGGLVAVVCREAAGVAWVNRHRLELNAAAWGALAFSWVTTGGLDRDRWETWVWGVPAVGGAMAWLVLQIVLPADAWSDQGALRPQSATSSELKRPGGWLWPLVGLGAWCGRGIKRWLSSLGRISYGFYIFHWPVLLVVNNMLGPRGLAFAGRGQSEPQLALTALCATLLAGGITALLALVSWRYFESPWLELKDAWPRTQVASDEPPPSGTSEFAAKG